MLEVVRVPDRDIPGERDWLLVEAGERLIVFVKESRADARMIEVARAVSRLSVVAS